MPRGYYRYANLKEKILLNSIVDEDTGCWNWTGSLNGKEDCKIRYGRVFVGSKKDRTNRRIGAHRASYMAFIGDVPDNLFVCHKCDNPKCVNPIHLFLGTRLDNMQDMIAKGRSLHRYGDQNPNHKKYLRDHGQILEEGYELSVTEGG